MAVPSQYTDSKRGGRETTSANSCTKMAQVLRGRTPKRGQVYMSLSLNVRSICLTLCGSLAVFRRLRLLGGGWPPGGWLPGGWLPGGWLPGGGQRCQGKRRSLGCRPCPRNLFREQLREVLDLLFGIGEGGKQVHAVVDERAEACLRFRRAVLVQVGR